jgi:DNA polymerase/3'-5' exonuclease PolX/sugar phosphate isomerase/epimerase
MLLGISCNYKDADVESANYNVLQLNIGELSEPKYPDDNILDNIPDFNIPIFIHSKICYNISKQNIKYPIKKEMKVINNQKYGKGIVIHLSKWYKSKRDEALQDIVDKLQILFDEYNASIILETSYNINSLGSITDDFEYIFKRLKKKRLGICIDTSHLYLTGHPINRPEYILEYLTELEIKVGLENVSLLHLNDIDSIIFGRHNEHLNIGDGLIFKNELSLNYIISFCYNYNIPIIFERSKSTRKEIDNEIKKVENIKNKLLFDNKDKFDLLLKNSIVLYFVNKLLSYYEVMNMDNSSILELKSNIFNSYKGGKYKLLKTDKGYQYNFTFEHSKQFYKIINEKDYSAFDYLFQDQKYLNIKELLDITSIGQETVRRLLENGIESLDQLKEQPLAIRKKLLTPFQQKIITNHKFIRLINFNDAQEIVNFIKKSYSGDNIYFFGSYYRIKNNLEEPRLIKDIDVLCVGNPLNLISTLKSIFNLKVDLYMGDEKKSFVFMYKKIYFTIELYICQPNEFPFMCIYLKGPVKQVKRIYSIAKAKGYKMNNKGITKDGERIYFETEKEIYDFLNIKPVTLR